MSTVLKNKHILISGASVSGPALAFWLQRYGFTVTIVEKVPELSTGGYKIDLRGKAVEVVKAMGLYEEIRQYDVAMKTATFVDEEGKKIAEMSADFLGMKEGDDVELLRGNLVQLLYRVTCNTCEYIFNDSIKTVKQDEHGVAIEFVSGLSRKFDLLVGADGIHSNVRSLVFGQESNFSYDLGGYHYAIYTLENFLNLDRSEMFYSKVNKLVNLYSTKDSQDAKALFIFRSPNLNYKYNDIAQQKEILSKMYAHEGWEIPKILKAMDKSPDFYMDMAKQIRMENWVNDRTVLIGDTAYSPTLASGQGTSLAVVAAYVLAGELFAADGNYQVAYREYENKMRPFVEVSQQLGETIMNQMIPKTPSWISAVITKIMSYLPLNNYAINKLRAQTRHAANCIQLKKYM